MWSFLHNFVLNLSTPPTSLGLQRTPFWFSKNLFFYNDAWHFFHITLLFSSMSQFPISISYFRINHNFLLLIIAPFNFRDCTELSLVVLFRIDISNIISNVVWSSFLLVLVYSFHSKSTLLVRSLYEWSLIRSYMWLNPHISLGNTCSLLLNHNEVTKFKILSPLCS